ncbi:hypothetical protein GGS20DRAFT_154175 [Poronia punctata]|nr:hypothetical protein GGS20DRAFT_154175 [Poronia punctata]
MLFLIRRSAASRSAQTAIATSFARSLNLQHIAQSRLPALCLGLCKVPLSRGFASEAPPKATATKPKSKSPSAKKTTKKSVGVKAKAKPKRKKKTVKGASGTAKKPVTKRKRQVRKKKLTEEEAALAEKKALKRAALFKEPKGLPSTARGVFLSRHLGGRKGFAEIQNIIVDVHQQFKSLTESELEELESIAKRNQAANAGAYKTWVESHTPAETLRANRARRILKRKYNHPKAPSHLKLIKDERLPKRPVAAYALFAKAKLEGTTRVELADGMNRLSAEWKALSDSERQVSIYFLVGFVSRY